MMATPRGSGRGSERIRIVRTSFPCLRRRQTDGAFRLLGRGEDLEPALPLGLLRARRERPRRRRTADQRDELAPPHSITSSARASTVGGISRPNIRAVCALMTSSNLADCSTGKSAGLAPLRMRPTYTANWRYVSTILVP